MTAAVDFPLELRTWLTEVMGESIDDRVFERYRARLEVLDCNPGAVCWESFGGAKGLYLVLAGKVRLFDAAGNPLASLGKGEAFGGCSLFGNRGWQPYTAKGALAKGTRGVRLLFLPAATIEDLWRQYPAMERHLQAAAAALEAKLQALSGGGDVPPSPVATARVPVVAASVDEGKPKAVEAKAPQKLYFPQPTVKARQWWQRWRRNYPFYAQQSSADCGVASLVMVGKYWGKDFSVNRLRDLAQVHRDGASLGALAAAAEVLGFAPRPVKGDLVQLAKQDLPAICHWEGNHYVVVYEIAGDRVIFGDPAIGQREVSRKMFAKHWTGYALLLSPTMELKNFQEKNNLFWDFIGLLKPHRGILVEIFLASIVLQVFGLVMPLLTQQILDTAVQNKLANNLEALILGMILFGFFQSLMRGLRSYLMDRTALRIDATMVVGFIRHTFNLPIKYFDDRHVGDITSRIEENHNIQKFLTGESVGTILDVMTVFVYLSLMFWYSPSLASFTIVCIPIFAILNLASTPFLRRLSREIFQADAKQDSYLIESLTGVRTVKSLAVERHVRWHWEELLQKSLVLKMSKEIFKLKLKFISDMFQLLFSTGLLWIGASLVIKGQMSLGQLVAFNMLVDRVVSPFIRLTDLWNEWQEIVISLERLGDVLGAQPEEDDRQGMRPSIGKIRGHIEFDRVSFKYRPDSDINILENLSFEIMPGQTIALVGRSGSGKSTLAKLILGLYSPTVGTISLDSKDINNVALKSIRQQVGVVDQDTFLFSGTIRENIVLSNPQATMEQLKQAAEMAGANEFIDRFPMGYETQIGEGGSMLSGGQRQRLAIARALISRSKILILDEATSSLDAESERLIQTNLEKIRRHRTTIIIAHRLSTVRNADTIFVLDRGSLVERGNHQELMQKRGHYYYLTQQQIGAS
jgi:HlyB family type I secretion system ABC transporter